MPRAATPVLDGLAREGILFEDATTVAPVTLVAHATVLTGLIPPSHGVRSNGSFRLPDGVTTLAERLHARGFATAAFVGSFVLSHEFGLDRGFDLYDDRLPAQTKDRKFDFAERRAEEVLARAGDWAVAKKDQPFFLWAHVYDPHAPYDPPAPYASRFAERPYDGEIAYVDAQLGKFFDKLRAAGIYDRALIVVTADHGEGLGEHGESTHGLFLYQSTMHVPLIVRPPGGVPAPGRAERRTVGIVDIAPTIVAVAGATWSGPVQGRSLAELIKREPQPPREPLIRNEDDTAPAERKPTPEQLTEIAKRGKEVEYYLENLMPHFSFGWAGLRGYRAGRFKLIRSVHGEFYDLSADPKETDELARQAPGLLAPLSKALDAAAAEAEAAAPSAPGAADNPGLSPRRASASWLSATSRPGPRAPAHSSQGPDPREMLPFFDGIDRAKDLLRSGKSDEGMAILRGLDAKGPPSVAVLDLLGQALMERGRFDEAMTVLDRAKKVDPGDYEVRRRLAEGHYALKHYEAAAAEAREALRLNARNAESRSILGAALARLGRGDEAIASFREAITQRPDEAALYYNLAFALEGAGRAPEAEESYARAVALDPASTPSRLALARLLAARGDAAGARAQLDAAAASSPMIPTSSSCWGSPSRAPEIPRAPWPASTGPWRRIPRGPSSISTAGSSWKPWVAGPRPRTPSGGSCPSGRGTRRPRKRLATT
jgi:arylsulfatase A-like enzyme/Flp pilus assembly protein TadD